MFSIVDLYLSDNKIEKFEGNPFNCLETLKSLWLKNNQIILDSNGRLMSRNDFKKNGFDNKKPLDYLILERGNCIMVF